MKKNTFLMTVLCIGLLLGTTACTSNPDKKSPQTGNTSTASGAELGKNDLHPVSRISHAHGLAVGNKDSSKLYIATHQGLYVLLQEKDLYQIGTSGDDYMGFSLHPTDPNIFFSSGHPRSGGNIGVQKSTNGGVTWTQISSGVDGPVDFHAMAVSPVDPNLIYGWYQGKVQRSIDQGSTWEVVNKQILAVYLAADSEDTNIVYAATPDKRGVLVSKDKGSTWQSLSPMLEGGQISVIAVDPKDARILLTFSERLGGLGKSTDHGKTWKKVSESFNGETVLQIAFDKNSTSSVYALTHENTLYKSTDTGDTWSKIKQL